MAILFSLLQHIIEPISGQQSLCPLLEHEDIYVHCLKTTEW